MPKIEVDEAEYVAQQQVTKLFADTLGNKEARELLLKAKKIVRPNEAIPEIDAAKPLQDELGKIREEMKADREARAAEKAEREASEKANKFQSEWDKQKTSLADEGWSNEGIANIETLAKERGIPDMEAAAALYRKLHPDPEVVHPSGIGRFDMFEVPKEGENDFMKKLLESQGQNDSIVDAEARKAIADVRGAMPRR
jgi:hypothetical protein